MAVVGFFFVCCSGVVGFWSGGNASKGSYCSFWCCNWQSGSLISVKLTVRGVWSFGPFNEVLKWKIGHWFYFISIMAWKWPGATNCLFARAKQPSTLVWLSCRDCGVIFCQNQQGAALTAAANSRVWWCWTFACGWTYYRLLSFFGWTRVLLAMSVIL